MKNDEEKIKVAIAEDHEILRQGLKALFYVKKVILK